MTSTLEHDIVDYLHAQADRVEVTSTLETIESDLIYLPRSRHDRSSHRLAPLLALASAVVLIVALAVVAGRGDTPTLTGAAAASDTTTESPVSLTSAPSVIDPTPASTTPAAPDTIANAQAPLTPAPSVIDPTPVRLPDGAVLNGVAPSCTATTDEVVFECTIAAFPEPLGTTDYTGYVSEIVDDTSHVSGGCRATNPDATAYLCYIGQRAVDEQIVGENFLGEWAPRAYAAG